MPKRLALLVATCVFVPGCDSPGTGDVTIGWAVGLTGSCEAADLNRVVATLTTGDGVVVAREEEYCSAGSILFRDIPAGSFRGRVVAYDSQMIEAYDVTIGGVEVLADFATGPYFGRLSPRPGEIDLVWYFAGGRLCSAYGIERVVVRAFAGDTEVLSKELPCDDGAASLRDLVPGTYDVRVDGETARGIVTHAYTAVAIDLRPGHRLAVDAELSECGDTCF
jgi:hypothetical protein